LRLCDADFGDLSALSGLQRLQLHNVSLREDAAPQAGVVAAGVVNFAGLPFAAAAAAHERAAGLMSWLQQQQELTHLELRGVEGLDSEYAKLDSIILQEEVQYLPPATYRALTSSSVLQHLDLRHTYLGIDAYQRAFPALRKVPSITCLLLPGDMCVKLPGNSSCRSVGCMWSAPSAILGCPNLRSIEVQGPNHYTANCQELAKQVNVTSLTLTYSLEGRLRMVPDWRRVVNGVAGMTQLLRLHLPAYEGCVHTRIPDSTNQCQSPLSLGTLQLLRDCFQELRQLTSLTQLTQLWIGAGGGTGNWPNAMANAWAELAVSSSSVSDSGRDHAAGAPGWVFINKVGFYTGRGIGCWPGAILGGTVLPMVCMTSCSTHCWGATWGHSAALG
jgi:hypothetical protein